LLRITSRGSAIIAELLRLSGNIPEIFLGEEFIRDPEQRKYLDILFDFHYLRDPETYERDINANAELIDIDQEFQENHAEILIRFYKLFESIWRYQADLAKFTDDVSSGFYIQHSLDSLLQDVSGRQLLCEALYLYGAMLLLLEEKIPGYIREKVTTAVQRTALHCTPCLPSTAPSPTRPAVPTCPTRVSSLTCRIVLLVTAGDDRSVPLQRRRLARAYRRGRARTHAPPH